jgi:hypothetical protein
MTRPINLRPRKVPAGHPYNPIVIDDSDEESDFAEPETATDSDYNPESEIESETNSEPIALMEEVLDPVSSESESELDWDYEIEIDDPESFLLFMDSFDLNLDSILEYLIHLPPAPEDY